MNNFRKYFNAFNDEYKEKIIKNKEILIKAFIKYYGYEYEDKIRSNYDKINFYWYVSKLNSEAKSFISKERVLDSALKKMDKISKILGFELDDKKLVCRLGNINLKDNKYIIDAGEIVTTGNGELDKLLEGLFGKSKIYDIDDKECLVNKIYQYDYDERNELLEKVFGQDVSKEDILDKIRQIKEYTASNYKYENNDKNKYLYFYIFDEYMNQNENNSIIGALNDTSLDENMKNNIHEVLLNLINDCNIDCAFSTTLADNIRVVALTTLITSDQELMHEVNHQIKASMLGYIVNGKVTPVTKSGICLHHEKQSADILEELLNDIEAEEITKIFHELGGNFFDNDILKYRIQNSGRYPKFYPLVERFYTLYKDIIKDASISDNINILYKRVNQEKLREYSNFITNIYNTYFDEDIPYDCIIEANRLIDELSIDLNREQDIDEYINELNAEGISVKKMN